jgi:YHS domain-containing protein
MRTLRTIARKLFDRSPASVAGADVNTTHGLTLEGPGLALRGYDPVAYFTEGKPVVGNATYTATYNNATYRFASEAHLKTFKASPAQYVPQYGGFCAFGVGVGAKFDGDPALWKIEDDNLYLNLSPDIQEQWEKDISGYITKADTNWPVIKDKAPAELG